MKMTKNFESISIFNCHDPSHQDSKYNHFHINSLQNQINKHVKIFKLQPENKKQEQTH